MADALKGYAAEDTGLDRSGTVKDWSTQQRCVSADDRVSVEGQSYGAAGKISGEIGTDSSVDMLKGAQDGSYNKGEFSSLQDFSSGTNTMLGAFEADGKLSSQEQQQLSQRQETYKQMSEMYRNGDCNPETKNNANVNGANDIYDNIKSGGMGDAEALQKLTKMNYNAKQDGFELTKGTKSMDEVFQGNSTDKSQGAAGQGVNGEAATAGQGANGEKANTVNNSSQTAANQPATTNSTNTDQGKTQSTGNSYLDKYKNPNGYAVSDDSKQWLETLAKNSNDQITFNEMADGYLKFQEQRMNDYLNPQPISCQFQNQTFGGNNASKGNSGIQSSAGSAGNNGTQGSSSNGLGVTGNKYLDNYSNPNGYSIDDQSKQWLETLAKNSNDQITFNQMADDYLKLQADRMKNYLNPEEIKCTGGVFNQ